MNKKLFAIATLIICSVFAVFLFYSDVNAASKKGELTAPSASAYNMGSGTTGYDGAGTNGTTGSTGNRVSRDTYKGVVCSWCTGWDTQTVPDSGIIHSSEIRYGSTVIPAYDIPTGEAAKGSEFLLFAVYANANGNVIKDGVSTPVEKGEVLAYIPIGGLKTENGYSQAWSMLMSSGEYGKVSIADAMARLNINIAAGNLLDVLRNNPELVGFGGMKNILEKILDCETECDFDPPDPVEKKRPIPSCHEGSHAGWTEGNVLAINMTKNTEWKSEIWARPGDTIQFSLYYCWGVGAVGGSADNNPKLPWAIYPDGNATAYGKAVTDVWFSISASSGAKYLFGKDEEIISGGKNNTRRSLANPHEKTIEAAAPELSELAGHDRSDKDYDFLYYSPSLRNADANKYTCKIFDFSIFTINRSHGYQIPGVGTGSCKAINNNGGNMNDAGTDISQTIEYSYDTAWQRYRHSESGKCDPTCTWQAEKPAQGEDGTKTYEDKDMNTLIEHNTNVQSNPYKTLQAALSANANNWGLIKKWANDTNEHGTATLGDCDYNGCSANKWQSYPYYSPNCGCAKTTSYDCDRDNDGNTDSEKCTKCVEYKPGPCWGKYDSSKKSHRHSYPGKSHYKPKKDYTTGMQQLGKNESTAVVHVPYSYRTSATSIIQEGDVIYTGETVYSMFTASIIPRIVKEVRSGEAYATVVPGYIKAVEFVVSADSTLKPSTGSSNAGSTDPCGYYSSLGMISGCNTIWEEHGSGGYLNEEGRYSGKTYSSGSVKRVVPDSYPIGSKYCVAVGISTSDSHSRPDAQTVHGMSTPSGWRISNLSCRTIAKKPNFEVWNGNFYTKGGVNTSTTVKRVGANLGDPTDPTGYFGSWEEYLLSAKGAVVGFSSGAGLGYYGGYNSNSLGLQGGTSPSKSYCDLSRMTIANDQCSTSTSEYYSNRYATGNSMIEDSATTLLERIRSRYTRSESSSIIRHLDNGATYIYSKGSTSTQALRDLPIAAGDNLGNATLTGRYIMQGRGIINNSSEQTTSNYASNTLIIHVSGDLTINTNICAGNGTCTNRNDTLKLGQRNSDTYTSIYSVPQILIIVDGNIVISDAVTQIDAWLIANGNINTCNGLNYSSNGFSASTCGRQLIVNGPVFANSLTLSRNSGANPGAGVGNNGGNPIDYNLTDDGSIQPAEIFNLRPDTLFWAYSQAQRYSQANVTYTRELAPRY